MTFATFDLEDVLREIGDETVAAELAAIVRTDVTSYADALEAAAAGGHMTRVRELAHAIKGAAGNVSANSVCDLASRIDNGLRTGQVEAGPLAPALAAECRRLVAELDQWVALLQAAHPANS
jgi:HPt (histidine-containing phosphotransfer) domain-containing protein